MLLYPEFNLQSKNTSYISKVFIVQVEVLRTLHGAIEFSLHAFKSYRKRSLSPRKIYLQPLKPLRE